MKTNGNGSGNGSGNGNGHKPCFSIASSMNRADYRSQRSTFLEELQSVLNNPNPPFDYKDKSNISWISVYNLPENVVQTLKKLSTLTTGPKTSGFQSAVRCAISMGLHDIHRIPYLKELKRLESVFNHLPQIGEPRELFLGQFFSTPLSCEFSGKRFNIPTTNDMKLDISTVSSAYSISESNTTVLAIILSLLRDGNEIPDRYRREWVEKVSDIDGLAQMKVQGAYSMIKTLPGAEDLVPIVCHGLSGLYADFASYFSGDFNISLDSLGTCIDKEEERGDEDLN